jgi:hypothetical protein
MTAHPPIASEIARSVQRLYLQGMRQAAYDLFRCDPNAVVTDDHDRPLGFGGWSALIARELARQKPREFCEGVMKQFVDSTVEAESRDPQNVTRMRRSYVMAAMRQLDHLDDDQLQALPYRLLQAEPVGLEAIDVANIIQSL